ncbi:MAG: bifunctional folylpolyglutamate synthase/dihydrofolate synthase [Aminipila sp.]
MEEINTIDKLKEFERFGSILGLERMTKLMELLGNPQDSLKYIHVAGTNGKGSVCRYIYEALSENGYKVGLFTSPFLEVFNERIEFNRELISDEDLNKCTQMVLSKVDEMTAGGCDSPTEFEVITAIAFVYFHLKKADFVVLEVGLGGKGDSTNIIKKPLACVISSISFDHTDRLGNTIEEIASEKAGIIKKGVPVIAYVNNRNAAKVIAKKAYEQDCVLHDVTKIKYAVTEKTINGYKIDTKIYGTDYSEVEIGMVGSHQVQNLLVALVTLELLRKSQDIKVNRKDLYLGIKRAKQIGRFEILEPDFGQKTEEPRTVKPYILIDGAHNEDGASALSKTIKEILPDYKTLMITGMLKDKDTKKILDSFCEIANDFIATEPENPRKLESELLAEELRNRGKNCSVQKTPQAACELALKEKDKYDLIVFAGSLYLIGEIRTILNKK